MIDSGVHVEPLRGGVLAGDDDVDVMAAAQAVVHDGEQAIGIGRKIDAHDLRLLVDDVVNEAGVLVGEAVVVLAPDVGGEEIIERGDLAPPGEAGGHLQPLGVLVEHRVNDMNKCFVAIEQAVAPGEEVAFEPAFALMLAEHFHDAAFGGEELVGRGGGGLPLPLGHLEDGLQTIGERSRRGRRCGNCVAPDLIW